MIYAYFAAHWFVSVLFQSMFQHRYAAHRMYEMSPRAERIMHALAFLVQGPHFLTPRAYAILHREHHAFSDTEKDPHSPWFFKDVGRMMWHTKARYVNYARRYEEPEERFTGGYPEWPLVDDVLRGSWPVTIAMGALFAVPYFIWAHHWYQWLLLPIQWILGPVHGAIVNWAGHKYGYRNFENDDRSRNSLPFDVLTMGELFQNNHHKFGMSPNFAARWFEIDPTWQVMKVLAFFGAIRITSPQRATYPLAARGGEAQSKPVKVPASVGEAAAA